MTKRLFLMALLVASILMLTSCSLPTLLFSVPSTIVNGQQTAATVQLLNAPAVAQVQFTVGVSSYSLATAGALPSLAFSAVPGPSNQLTCVVPAGGGGYQCTATPLAGSATLPSGVIATFNLIVNNAGPGTAAPSVTGISATDAGGTPVSLATITPLSVTLQ